MKLTYGDTVLGDDAAGDMLGDEAMTHERIVQEDNLAFGTQPFIQGRDNRKNTFSYLVDKVHADEPTAARYVRTHPDALPLTAQLKWENGTTSDLIPLATLRSVNLVKRDG
jgi:hypothetical protein